MLDETFYLDGMNALCVGIHLQNPIMFSKPVSVVEKVTIPGRNGDLIFDTGSYENRTGDAKCFALATGEVELAIRSINKFLFSKRGYRKLETSNDPEHFWIARVVNGARLEQRLRTLAPFEISFDCKPQRFVKRGFEKIRVKSGDVLLNQYGFDAHPFISIYGNGAGFLEIGNKTIEILSMTDVLHIDCDRQDAYNNLGNQNKNIRIFDNFPVLSDGENDIRFGRWDGTIVRVEITPRWWEL